MSSRKAKSTTTETTNSDQLNPDALEAGLEATVAAYLGSHPDFFERNPKVLERLEVAHRSRGVVSLIEHQVKVLRRQLETERGRLSHLIGRARDYESLSNRLHGLVLQLIPATDLEQLRGALNDALCREFSAEAVTLKLFPLDPQVQSDGDPLTIAFQGFLDRDHALCGPLDADKNHILFGELGDKVQCAALIPIRALDRSGVLAIGAVDPHRFHPDMGTELLDRLGEIVGHKLRTFPPLQESAPKIPPQAAFAAAPRPVQPEAPAPETRLEPEARPSVVSQPD